MLYVKLFLVYIRLSLLNTRLALDKITVSVEVIFTDIIETRYRPWLAATNVLFWESAFCSTE